MSLPNKLHFFFPSLQWPSLGPENVHGVVMISIHLQPLLLALEMLYYLNILHLLISLEVTSISLCLIGVMLN
jgi:hypothetical protein